MRHTKRIRTIIRFFFNCWLAKRGLFCLAWGSILGYNTENRKSVIREIHRREEIEKIIKYGTLKKKNDGII